MKGKAKPSADQSSLFEPHGADVVIDLGEPHEAAAPESRPQRTVVTYCDGGSRGNPGPAAIGAVVFDASDLGVALAEVSECIGIATNNVAEYKAMIAGLAAALDLGATVITARADSKLLIEQLKGNYKVKHPNLQPLHAEAAKLLRRFDRVTLEHVRREFNTEADALVNQALDAAGRR